MSDQTASGEKKPRRPYVPPVVSRVSLRPEEAVLSVCKTASSAGQAQDACYIAGSSCQTLGS
jgi:hypothetical protein